MSMSATSIERGAGLSTRARRLMTGLAAGAALFASTALLAAPAGAAPGALTADPSGPLSCTPGKIVMITPNAGGPGMQISYGTFGAGTISFAPVATPNATWNSTGYNPLDGYVYGVSSGAGDTLYRFGDDGTMTTMGTLSPAVGATNNGTFDDAGNFYVLGYPDLDIVKKINITTLQTTNIQLSQDVGAPDFAYMGGYLWGIGGNQGSVYRVDPNTGNVATITVTGLPHEPLLAGGAFAYPNGDLGFFIQTLGQFDRISVTNPTSGTPTASIVSTQATDFPSGDATACSTSITDLSLTVTSPPTAAPNVEIPFTLTITNNGPNPSSGWTLNAPIPGGVTTATTTTPGCSITGGTLSCTGGELGSGDSTTVQVNLTGPDSGSVNLVGTVTANDSDAITTNNVDDSTTDIAPDGGVPMLDPMAGGTLLGGLVLLSGAVLLVKSRRRGALR